MDISASKPRLKVRTLPVAVGGGLDHRRGHRHKIDV